jgi:DNA-binding response OmpR family regulator
MLPGLDGFEVCKHIRDKTDSPILMVSARGEEHDKIRGLGLGADDYITKPFSPSELVARVNANLAQYDRLKPLSERPAQPIQLGALQINQLSRRVLVSGREVDLKNKEYELLVMLASNPDTVFSKEQIYEAIWGQDAFGDLKTVAVHINRLREKIESDPQNPQFIQTVWGAGYRLKI